MSTFLSQTVEYAMRASICLGRDNGVWQTSQQIAETTQVPSCYLFKVLQLLARAGLVESRRGLHGGYTLLRPPEEISMLNVVNAVDPMQRIVGCPVGLPDHAGGLCSLHHRLDETIATIESIFAGVSLADLINDPQHASPMLEMRVEDRR